VRLLFLDTWRKLGAAVRSAARRGQLGARGLEFLSFISAGDALFALDQAAPALGMRISAEDLRRLAHIMAPSATGDPLQFDFAEDPMLRSLLGLPAGPLSSPPEGAPPSPLEAPAAPSPSASPTPDSASPQASRWFRLPWSLIEPREACASEAAEIVPQLKQIAIRLRRAVVDEG